MEKINTYPHNLEAEQGVLCCIMLGTEDQLEYVAQLTEKDFFTESHKYIFNSMKDTASQNKPIDIVTISDNLEKNGNLERAGGIDYLVQINNFLPSSVNYKYYYNIVKRDSTLRKLINASENIIKDSMTSDDSVNSLSNAEKLIYNISEQQDKSSLTIIKHSFSNVLSTFESIQKDKNYAQGLKTGFTKLDELTNGFKRGNLIILAARPSVGKSTLAMNIVENVALRENAVCAVFALEMTKDELAQRMLCSVANVSSQNATHGKLTDEDWQRLWTAQRQLSNTNIFIDDTSMTTYPEIISKCRRLKSKTNRLDLVVVDHIQIMASDKTKGSDGRQQEISDISRGLKMLAKELDVPVLALSQLSRNLVSTARKGDKPQLSDLRDSGAIEQDADIVFFIHDPNANKKGEQEHKQQEEGEQGKQQFNPLLRDILVRKNRSGPCDEFSLVFKGEQSKFMNPTREYLNQMQPINYKNKEQENEKSSGLEKAFDDEESYFDNVPIGEAPPEEEVNNDLDDVF